MKLPLKLTRNDACFTIEDAAHKRLAFIYFEDEPIRAEHLGFVDEREARVIAKAVARALRNAADELNAEVAASRKDAQED